eukprot:5527123-Prorocentrum_lima.AAC.1
MKPEEIKEMPSKQIIKEKAGTTTRTQTTRMPTTRQKPATKKPPPTTNRMGLTMRQRRRQATTRT